MLGGAYSHTDTRQCNFWSLETWNEHKKSKKGMTSVGKVIGRRGRKPKGTNTDTHGFLENVDGTPAHAREYELARQWAHDVLDMCINLDVDLPASWKDIDIRIKQMRYDELRATCPLLQACDRNYKAKIIMSSVLRGPRSDPQQELQVARATFEGDADRLRQARRGPVHDL